MIREWSKKVSKNQHKIKNHNILKIFGEFLHRREFWNLNRSSVSKGVSIGLFWAFIPMPFQMVAATICAFIFRGNIAISVVMIWITNPLTMPLIYYICYKLGVVILGREEMPFLFEASYEWMFSQFNTIFIPLLLGSVVVSVVSSFFGYFVVQYLWFHSTRKDVNRKNKRFKIFDRHNN